MIADMDANGWDTGRHWWHWWHADATRCRNSGRCLELRNLSLQLSKVCFHLGQLREKDLLSKGTRSDGGLTGQIKIIRSRVWLNIRLVKLIFELFDQLVIG